MEATYKKYGYKFPVSVDALNAECMAFRYCLQPKYSKARDPEGIHNERGAIFTKHGMGAAEHFKRIAHVLFPKFIWHPIADSILEAACRTNYLGVAGCSHIGKSQIAAIWGIINYIVDPSATLVLMTSTSIAGAKKRVWGAVEDYWRKCPGLPGKLVSSPTPAIKGMINDKGKISDARGIFLVPSEQSKSTEVAGKLKGMKAPRVFLVADELPELSQSLVNEALNNLTNNEYFHMTGLGNPRSFYDPFGKFVEPDRGWDSISVETDEWATKIGGICVHFDGLKSPNYLAGEDIWPILKKAKIEDALARGGQNTLDFWSNYRGFWPPSGVSDTIYSEADIERFDATKKAIWGQSRPVVFAGFDPSFTSGGDKAVLSILKIGNNAEGFKIIELVRQVALLEDVTNKTESRDFQIVRQLMTVCQQEGVAPENFATDATGAGITFAGLLEQLWSRKIMRVNFGGGASDRPVLSHEGKKGKEVFVNRVTEIAFSGLEFLRSGQLRGLTPELIKELVSRRHVYKGTRIQAEPKGDMKSRGVSSPDYMDSYLVGLTLARERLSLVSGGIGERRRTNSLKAREMAKKYDAIYRTRYQR